MSWCEEDSEASWPTDLLCLGERERMIEKTNTNARMYQPSFPGDNERKSSYIAKDCNISEQRVSGSMFRKSLFNERAYESMHSLASNERKSSEFYTGDVKIGGSVVIDSSEDIEVESEPLEIELNKLEVTRRDENVVLSREHPIVPIYKQQTNITYSEYRIHIKYNYIKKYVQYFIVNEYTEHRFLLSETPITIIQVNEFADEIIFRFGLTDIGSYAHLLIQDGREQYFIPLTMQPIQGNTRHQKTFHQCVESNNFSCRATIIDLEQDELEEVLVSNLEDTFRLKNKQRHVSLFEPETVVTHPCCLYYAPLSHPTISNVLIRYDDFLSFSKKLTFSLDYFFTHYYFNQLRERYKKKLGCLEEADYYLLLRIRTELFVLEFSQKCHRDLTYLCWLQENDYLFKLEDEKVYMSKKGQKYEKFIQAERNASQDDQPYFVSTALFRVLSPERKKESSTSMHSESFNQIRRHEYNYINEHKIMVTNNTDNCITVDVKTDKISVSSYAIGPTKRELQLHAVDCYKNIFISAYDYYGVEEVQLDEQYSLREDFDTGSGIFKEGSVVHCQLSKLGVFSTELEECYLKLGEKEVTICFIDGGEKTVPRGILKMKQNYKNYVALYSHDFFSEFCVKRDDDIATIMLYFK